jgi:hypothetical protein
MKTEPAHRFDSAGLPHLLRRYAEHATFRAGLQTLIDRSPIKGLCYDDKAKGFEAMLRARDRDTKALMSLATRMRLTNQSPDTPAAAGRAARNDRGAGRRSWEEPGPADEYFTAAKTPFAAPVSPGTRPSRRRHPVPMTPGSEPREQLNHF